MLGAGATSFLSSQLNVLPQSGHLPRQVMVTPLATATQPPVSPATIIKAVRSDVKLKKAEGKTFILQNIKMKT